MTLIKSISGIRGTIGGSKGNNLTAQDLVECTAGFATWISKNSDLKKVVVGRDGRITGKIVSDLVCSTLQMMGFDVVDLGLSTTPTVEIAVPAENAAAGIILTASHNPKQWNALKFLNAKGEFISKADGEEILAFISSGEIEYADVDHIGGYDFDKSYINKHIQQILDLDLIDVQKIKNAGFNVVVDCINSTGAIAIPPLLEKLGCEYTLINADVTGDFAHNPEPLPAHLKELSETVVKTGAHLGISVDPDVDRLAFVSENGDMFGEEYTLVAVADFILGKKPGNTVSNLSSTAALKDVTIKNGGTYEAAAVGEVNVVNKMKETNAVIGGEGNGGVIFPELHYGRDALVGIAFMLNLLAEREMPLSELKATYPTYTIIKNKIQLTPEIDVDGLLSKLEKEYAANELNTVDGLKIHFDGAWVHLRKSNTEPIIRVYAEAKTEEIAADFIGQVQNKANEILNS
ncbi:phosphoglucosamine mutase [Portibacter lacus]|uniref:Phosphoglucosamine mutase n=1 Tax=Portibacter lacus TaxID=1099794 RepID=A0AA37SMC4_9BACT|nr:phosphoglucosamine mutase [Portibacter lacus]GLR15396.1 phosphoglucosamine mutase [Portibacter lacus]